MVCLIIDLLPSMKMSTQRQPRTQEAAGSMLTGRGRPLRRLLLAGRCRARAAASRSNSSRRGGAGGAAGAARPGLAAVASGWVGPSWECRRDLSQRWPRHVGVFQRTGAPLLLLYIPARGLCSSPIQSKKEKEEEKQAQPATAPTTPAVDAVDAHARETVWTTPNLITMSRIAASPLLSWAILEGHYDWAVAGVAVAAATDWLDGYIAKTYNQTSVLGGFLDPLADKVLVAALSIPLAIQGYIPMALLFVVFGRDALLIAGSFIKRAANRPEGSPFFDTTSSATFQITPNLLSKTNTVLQFGVLTLALSRALWDVPSAEIFEPLCWLTGATTVGSGLTYLVGDGTKVLKRQKTSKQEPPSKAPPSA